MKTCGVCQKIVKVTRNIFGDSIGEPPILISKLLMRLIKNQNELLTSNVICRKCVKYLIQYNKAAQITHSIRDKFILLMKKPRIQTEKNTKKSIGIKEEIEINADSSNKTNSELEANDSYNSSSTGDISKSLKEDWPQLNNFLQIQPEQEREQHVRPNIDLSHWAIQDTIESDKNVVDFKEKAEKSIETIKNNSKTNDEKVARDLITDADKLAGLPLWAMHGKHKQTSVRCETCDRVFENHKTYQAHKKHEDFPGYVCEQCGVTLFSHSGFINHVKSHRDFKEFECKICGAQFHRKTKLNHHMAWHIGDKKFQCEICAKCFVHRVALTKHKQIHSDATRRNECKECGAKFRTKTHLTRHMSKHTGAKPHSCPICGKCYTQPYILKSHIAQHENPTLTVHHRFKCQKCLKGFARVEKYEEHSRTCSIPFKKSL